MTTPPDDEPQFVDDDHAAIAGFAAAYLDEDEQEAFIDHLMERRGYQRVSSWAPPNPGNAPPPEPEPDQPPRRRGGAAAAPAARRRAGYFKR